MALFPWFRRRRRASLTPDQRAAVLALVASPKFELIPLKNALDRAEALPPRSRTTVTASPTHGIEATFDLAEALQARGHTAIPHVSAHMIRDRAHLAELLDRARASNLREAFVVGGDAKDKGEFHDGLSLLRAIDELGHPFDEIGVPAYPDGHVSIDEERLVDVLLEKQRLASSMTTQMCFDPGLISAWLVRMRRRGVSMRMSLGTPGVTDVAKLMTISARIGVADSARYLKKNRKQVGRLLTPGSYGPDALLEGMAPTLADPEARVSALHVFTFNQVEATVTWRRRMLEALEDQDAPPTGDASDADAAAEAAGEAEIEAEVEGAG
jgi:methylenetetrahydrofolate reductase (NADH)